MSLNNTCLRLLQDVIPGIVVLSLAHCIVRYSGLAVDFLQDAFYEV